MKILQKLRSSGLFELICVLQLGVGSNFMFTGYDTSSFIMESVIHSVHSRRPLSIDEYAGYYGQAVLYIFFTCANFFTPLLIRYANPKWSLFLGSLCFTAYLCCFFYLNTYLYYILCAVNGLGFAMFYAGSGCYLTEHSTKKNLARNSSLAWGIMCTSMTLGGIVLLIVFQKNNEVSEDGRYRDFTDKEIRIIFGIFALISFVSNMIFVCLPKGTLKDAVSKGADVSKNADSFGKTLFSTFKTFASLKVWLLASSWLYLGLVTTFYLGLYPTSFAFTQSLSKSKMLLPLYSIAIGFGEFSTGIFVTFLSRRFNNFGRIPVIAMGTVVNLVAFALVFLSTPRYSTLHPTDDTTLLLKPNVYIAVMCGYLLGFGDCCWNTARSCIIPALMPESRAEGFAVSKIFQSVSTFAIYFLSSEIDLYTHFGILIVFLVLCNSTFLIALRREGKREVKERGMETVSTQLSFDEKV